MKINYNIGDVLVALKPFPLSDRHQKTHYFGEGDKFVIVDLADYNDEIRFQLAEVKSLPAMFLWTVEKPNEKYNELKEFQEYLVHKKDYLKISRKLKLKQINEH